MTSVILYIVAFSNQRAIDLTEVDLGWVEPKTFSSKYILLKTWNLAKNGYSGLMIALLCLMSVLR
jgi:hypothetical protein